MKSFYLIEFKYCFAYDVSFAGKSFPLTINNGQNIILYFPKLIINSPTITSSELDSPLPFSTLNMSVEPWKWGEVVTSNGTPELRIKSVVIECINDAANHYNVNVTKFIEDFPNTLLALNPEVIRIDADDIKSSFVSQLYRGGDCCVFGSFEEPDSFLQPFDIITDKMFSIVCDNIGKTPILQRSLLMYAYQYLIQKDYRGALLNYASIIDSTYKGLIRDRLKTDLPQEAVDRICKKLNGFLDFRNMASSLGIIIGYDQHFGKIMEKRNHVIHEAETVVDTDVKPYWQEMKRLVNDYYPDCFQ